MSINGSDLEALLGESCPFQTVTQISPIVWFHFGAHVWPGRKEEGVEGKQKEGTGNRVIPTRTRRMLEMPSSCVARERKGGLVSIWWSLCHSNSMLFLWSDEERELNDYHERSRYSRVDLRRKFVISIALLKTLIQACLVIIFYHRSIIQPKTAVLFFNLHHMHPVPHGNKMGGTVGDGQALSPPWSLILPCRGHPTTS